MVKNSLGVVFYSTAAILTLGMSALMLSWTRRLKFIIRYARWDGSNDFATHVLIDTEDGNTVLCPIVTLMIRGESHKYIEFRYVRYFLQSGINDDFVVVDFLDKLTNYDVLHSKPLSSSAINEIRMYAGDNSLKTPVTPYLDVLVEEILGGFNVYQLIACVVWFFRNYELYASLIIICMLFTIILDLYENRKAQLRLRQIAEIKGTSIVRREREDSSTESTRIEDREIDITYVVPTDHIQICDGMKAPCDIIVISGECLVNEAVLTGESIPVAKTTISDGHHMFDCSDSDNFKHLIFCGSTVIRASNCQGFVSSTGFSTLKGKLTRSILYPKRTIFKHEIETYKFLIVLLILSLGLTAIFYIYQIFIVDSPRTIPDILFIGLDIVFITLPPGLPLCLLVGISFAVKKLRDHEITCLRPFLINAAGRVKTFCFDKTGTLTNSTMDFTGISIMSEECRFIL